MIRVGLIEIETSHKKAFTTILHGGDDARVVSVFPGAISRQEGVDAFIKEFGVGKVAASPEAMVPDVDIAFILGTNWDRHIELAMPFVKAGKPVFIDKPICGCLKDCLELERLVREGGARIVGSSSLRYAPEFVELRKTLAETNDPIAYASTTIKGEFDYNVHAVEMLGGIVGTGAQSVQYLGGSSPAIYYVAFANGLNTTLVLNGPVAGGLADVATARTFQQIRLAAGGGYKVLMQEIIKYMKGEEHILAPIEALTESIRICLAARESRKRGGAVVRLSDMNASEPGFDGTAFARAYASK